MPKFLLFATLAGILAMNHSALAASETKFRDFLRTRDPIYEKLWAALKVDPLKRHKGTVLRIYDEWKHLTISASGDRVTVDLVKGEGGAFGSVSSIQQEGAKHEKSDFTVREYHLEITEPQFASDLAYLTSHQDALDTNNRGADGSTAYFEALSPAGSFTTFEVWSPDEKVHPMTFELQMMFDRLDYILWNIEIPKKDWENHGFLNFMTNFTHVSSLNLTQEVARAHVMEAMKLRIHKLVNALKGI